MVSDVPGCFAPHPTTTCFIGVDTEQFPPGTIFEVEVQSISNGLGSAFVPQTNAAEPIKTQSANPPHAVDVTQDPSTIESENLVVDWGAEGDQPEQWKVYYRERGNPDAPFKEFPVPGDGTARDATIPLNDDEVGKAFDVYVVGIDASGEEHHKAGEEATAVSSE